MHQVLRRALQHRSGPSAVSLDEVLSPSSAAPDHRCANLLGAASEPALTQCAPPG
jgi:hypothetical protein